MEFDLVNAAESQIHALGGRMTNQRRMILQALIECADHPTAEEIYQKVREKNPALNLSTVYRTLRWLEQHGLVNIRRFDDEPRLERFDPVIEHGEDHFHFRCRNCNQITEFDTPLINVVKAQFVDCFGGEIENATLVLYGLCSECFKKS
ncbi:Fur family transcriptional regulator [Bellilinea sp.]|jgi:Fe2+ or Zn2+ uptake regulation protein|uniref:Fur family transcriptional regulator n=1 Tax=Bellilinea sp. TaxID=2838785 RepID=UPI002ADE365E|nr:transcriptional repressor [Bellilinea sp.]